MDTTHQKLESGAVTFCYPVPRTLQTLTIKGLHKNLNTLVLKAQQRIHGIGFASKDRATEVPQ
jgi:hypothetical protein